MIYIDVIGNKGEGTMQTVKSIVANLIKNSDTFRVFVVDDWMEYKPSPDIVTNYRMISLSSAKKLEEVFVSDYEEKMVVVYPMIEMNVKRAVMHHMVDNTEVNCNKKVYCIHLCYSI